MRKRVWRVKGEAGESLRVYGLNMIRKTWTLEWTKNEMKTKERTKSLKIKEARRTTQKTKRRRSKTKSPKEQRNWRKTQKDWKRVRIF